MHRWDAQRAIGLSPKIDTAFAEDGVDEYWTVMLPRMLIRESLPVPASAIGVSLTDTGRQWTIDGRSGAVRLADDGVEAAAVLTGTAEAMLLRLWGRPVPDGAVTVSGDADVAAAWLALGGA